MDGWFDASGLGRLGRGGQIFGDGPYGILIGTFYSTLDSGDILGDLTTFSVPSAYLGQELQLGLNMSLSDQNSLEGAFRVHVTRFTAAEMTEATVVIGPDSPRPLGTGIMTTDTDQEFLVIGQGAARVITSRPITEGWFDASGLGAMRRAGQIFPDTPYGCLLGTLNGSISAGFNLGDVAAWGAQSADVGDELMVGLNMSASDQLAMEGEIVVHVLRIDHVVVSAVGDAETPDRDAIVAVDSYPNPFNPMTTVRFELSREQRVRVTVVNVAGEVVRSLAHATYSAGQHELAWDGRDDAGRSQASGTYLLRLETAGAAESRKLTLVR